MRNKSILLLAILLLLAVPCGRAEEVTAIYDGLSLSLPRGIIALTAEEAAQIGELQPILKAISDGAETLFIGELPADGAGGGQFGAVYIVQREKETAAATGVADIGTYADTNEFAFGLSEWYKKHFSDFYIVDVLSGQNGAPVFIVHAETEEGMILLGETYSTDYSDTVVACFFDGNGKAAEPTQEQYDAFSAMLKTVRVK